MNLQIVMKKVLCFLSPMKFAAWVILFLAFTMQVSNPFFHYTGGPNSTPPTPVPEAIYKTIFIFCAAFTLLGNGKTIRLRLGLVLVPYYYLTLLYIIKSIQTQTQSLILPTILLCLLTVWLSVAGEYYELTNRKCPSFVDSYIAWIITKFNPKVNRQNKG